MGRTEHVFKEVKQVASHSTNTEDELLQSQLESNPKH